MAFPPAPPTWGEVFDVFKAKGIILRTVPGVNFRNKVTGITVPCSVFTQGRLNIGLGHFNGNTPKGTRVPWAMLESWARTFNVEPSEFGLGTTDWPIGQQ